MKTLVLAILAALLLSTVALAQNQAGAVAIAEQIRPVNGDATMEAYWQCGEKFVKLGANVDKAIDACKDGMKIIVGGSKKIAINASKAARTQIVLDRWGRSWSSSGYYADSAYQNSMYRDQRRDQVEQNRLRLRDKAEESRQQQRTEAEARRAKDRADAEARLDAQREELRKKKEEK